MPPKTFICIHCNWQRTVIAKPNFRKVRFYCCLRCFKGNLQERDASRLEILRERIWSYFRHPLT